MDTTAAYTVYVGTISGLAFAEQKRPELAQSGKTLPG
jgi:hypothetical protein